jgi:hypothetical protein
MTRLIIDHEQFAILAEAHIGQRVDLRLSGLIIRQELPTVDASTFEARLYLPAGSTEKGYPLRWP